MRAQPRGSFHAQRASAHATSFTRPSRHPSRSGRLRSQSRALCRRCLPCATDPHADEARAHRSTTWAPERVQVEHWRRHGRLDDPSRTRRTAHAALRWTRAAAARRCSKNSTSPTTSTCSSVPSGPPARQPVPTAARDRACSCDTAGRPQDLARTGDATRTVAPGLLDSRTRTTRAMAATAVAQRRVRRSQGPVPAERRSHVERIVLDLSIHTRSPRARTRLHLSSVARQRRTRRRRADRGAERPTHRRRRSSRR